jgi:hypothetical protein
MENNIPDFTFNIDYSKQQFYYVDMILTKADIELLLDGTVIILNGWYFAYAGAPLKLVEGANKEVKFRKALY